MPFDGTGREPCFEALGKIDQVIDLLASDDRWCKGRIYTEDGRRCLLGALKSANAQSTLKAPILAAIRQVTGRQFTSIPRFNDDLATTHATVLRVLERARANIEAGVYEPPRSLLKPQWASALVARFRSPAGV